MPAHPRPLREEAGPLAAFARDLRALRDSARPPVLVRDIARPSGKYVPGDPRYDRPARQTIYAALSGKQLPSEQTLEALVRAWSARSEEQLTHWMARRREVQEQLALDARERTTTPFSAGIQSLFVEVPKIIDHSVEAAAFHARLKTLLQERKDSLGWLSKYPEKTAYAVYSGYRLPSDHVLDDFIRIAMATEEEASELRSLWRAARVSVSYLAAMVISAGGQGLMANAELKEMNLESYQP